MSCRIASNLLAPLARAIRIQTRQEAGPSRRHLFQARPLSIPNLPRRFLSSATPSAPDTPVVIPRSLPRWLFGCSGLVFGILVIGGLTRLTESGLSITEWQPITGILPPISDKDWQEEWEKYRLSPEGVLMNSKIGMGEFKKIFYMEWAHRVAGRLLGAAFVLPAAYYMARYRLPGALKAKLGLLGVGIGAQGAIGWYMVKSGLEQEIIDTKGVPRVSQYRLAAHLSAALALYIVMLATAIGLRRDVMSNTRQLAQVLQSPAVRRYKHLSHLAAGMVFVTAVSGAFVAGLDAGLVYNEFPTMGGRLIPPVDELMDKRYAKSGGDRWWRNMLENPVTAQFDHRLLAMTTFCVLLSLPILARRPALRSVLPKSTRRLTDLTAAAAVAQVTLGITTLLYLVPTHLAATHQAGSVVLLTCLTALISSMRRPSGAVALLKKL
ncbi:COX15/CtaA family [Naematelia encephala]|uniref:COX15/CtaA family n=1 Tax=Naematelia encephala TaxID=71784 RepID=A0A1Y2B9W0_9TREE|nr:COX15/CtaA family [Naematelia encephala]